jgi:cystathionine beta-lyase
MKHACAEKAKRILKGREKLWVNEGNLYGEAGEGFVRINIACPRQRLIEGLNRMRRALSSPITSFT